MVDCLDEVLDFAQPVVIGNKDPEFTTALEKLRDGQPIMELVRITEGRSNNGKYDGIC